MFPEQESIISSSNPIMDGLATALVVISILFPILSAFVLILRLLARRMKALRIQLEDYMIIVAWVRVSR